MMLLPGVYLVELFLGRPIAPDDLTRGLEAMGWEEVAIDEETLPAPPKIVRLVPKEPDPPFEGAVVRFVGRLERAIEPVDTAIVRWNVAEPVPLDPFAPMLLKGRPFPLLTEASYALHFMSRMRAQPNRRNILETLEKMGFDVARLSELKRNTRLPGRPGASVSYWYAVARWTKPNSYVNTEDPFYFEDVKALEKPSALSLQPSAGDESEKEKETG